MTLHEALNNGWIWAATLALATGFLVGRVRTLGRNLAAARASWERAERESQAVARGAQDSAVAIGTCIDGALACAGCRARVLAALRELRSRQAREARIGDAYRAAELESLDAWIAARRAAATEGGIAAMAEAFEPDPPPATTDAAGAKAK